MRCYCLSGRARPEGLSESPPPMPSKSESRISGDCHIQKNKSFLDGCRVLKEGAGWQASARNPTNSILPPQGDFRGSGV